MKLEERRGKLGNIVALAGLASTTVRENVGSPDEAARMTPIEAAVASGSLETVKSVLNGEIDGGAALINQCFCLHAAAERGALSVVQFLLTHCGAHVDLAAQEGHTALHLASMCGHLEVVRCLVHEHGANIHASNAVGETPLHAAAWAGMLPVAQYLCECGADVQARDSRGFTAMHTASMFDENSALSLFLRELELHSTG